MPYVERELLLKDGPPWGFRLQDTASQGLVISRIRRRSPAASAGVHEGDVVLEINKNSTNGMSHLRAVQVLESTFYILTIRVGRQEARAEPPPPPPPQPVAPEPVPVASSMQLNFSWQASRPLPRPEPEPEPPPPPPVKLRFPKAPPPPPADLVVPASPGIKPVPISRLIREYEAPLLPKSDRKHFADSAFYEDPDKYYPSVEEQKQMAKRVADSLTAALNRNSRGARMFERRRNKWALAMENEEEEVHSAPPVPPAFAPPPAGPAPFVPTAPQPPPAALAFGAPLPSALGLVPPPPPPPPPLALLASLTKPRPTQEVFEQAKQLPKSTHDKIAPQQCFDIAAALHSSSSRGSKLFAKRRAKAKKWEVEGPEPQAEPQPAQPAVPAKTPPLWAANAPNAAFVSPSPSPGPARNGAQGRDSISNMSSSSSMSGHSMVIHSTPPEYGSPSPSNWSAWRPQAAQLAASSPYDIASPRSGSETPRDSAPGFFGSLPRGGGGGNGAKPSEWRPVQFKLPPKVA